MTRRLVATYLILAAVEQGRWALVAAIVGAVYLGKKDLR